MKIFHPIYKNVATVPYEIQKSNCCMKPKGSIMKIFHPVHVWLSDCTTWWEISIKFDSSLDAL